MKRRYPYLLVLSLPFALGACGFTDWANTHMPVIGERCENWQCFTSSGQEASRLNQQQRVAEQSNAYATGGAPVSNAPGTLVPAGAPAAPGAAPAAAAAPAQPLAPAAEEGAYVYVPRAPAAPGTTPFDGPQ